MAAESEEEERSLFVSNLGDDVSDEILYELFFQAGPIEKCTVVEYKTERVGTIIYKHTSSVRYAQDIYKGTSLFGEEIKMSTKPPPVQHHGRDPPYINPNVGRYPPDKNFGQSVLRGERPVDHGYRDNYYPDWDRNDRRNHRPDRNHHHDRRRVEPYHDHRGRREENDRHRHGRNRSHHERSQRYY